MANSFLYFIHVSAFAFGAQLVEDGEMEFVDVFRVFIVINFASISIGRSVSAMPDYSAAKAAANNVLKLCDKRSKIDPNDQQGLILVCTRSDSNGEIEQMLFFYSRIVCRGTLSSVGLPSATKHTLIDEF